MIKTARAERKAADEAKAEAERSASPAESGATVEEIIEETKSEPAAAAQGEEEDDAPPELEHVDAEKLKVEQEAASKSESAK